MERETTLGALLTEIKTDIKALIDNKLEWLKLESYDKAATLGSFLIFGFIVLGLVLFALLFAFVALGFVLSNLVGSLGGGFGIVTLLYLVLLLLLFLCRKSVTAGFRDLFLKELDPRWDQNINDQQV
jgi:lipopolysaccharide export LptBFGC system permease protein LptF